MSTVMMMSPVLLVIIFITAKRMIRKKKATIQKKQTIDLLQQTNSKKEYRRDMVAIERKEVAAAVQENTWWNELDMLSQLHLAVMLAEKALPVWLKYTGTNNPVYQDSPFMPFNQIDAGLLQSAIKEIILTSQAGLPPGDNKIIYQCYFNFVGPVIAIKDGTWVPPYPVRKIFSAVYHILKCIMEQDNPSGVKHFLATAINEALDCMDMSKLYSKEEINVFLQTYKNALPG